ncbi:MAG: hypothetical protein CFE23_13590 [Flavobacterium sp. BFFFF1]|uniref:group III truncated hemoglobin n=1 Tax=unclassified Flavobacterium TaxID=196869 RepID=UPI000BD7BB51|nr:MULTISPECIES: group III truncated hemoglobin [unclassified Flavobacterium]OYU79532.1 MAG: hypothetical protein CFE23_13590 [Flavobacterium sp. BFFFF1]
MEDIKTRADLELIMDRFYTSILKNPEINHFFDDVVKVGLEKHLPVIVDFWEQMILKTGNYKSNVFEIHRKINERLPFNKNHFSIWLDNLNRTIDFHFKGNNAEKMKTSALSIATIMQLKLDKRN